MGHPLSPFAQRKMVMPGCGWIILSAMTGVGVIFLLIHESMKISKIRKQDDCDYNAATDLNGELSRLSILPPSGMGAVNNLRVFRNFSVGEVTRHFDSQTNSQITGWLDHNFTVVGWGVGFQIGSAGLGTGQIRIPGRSDVHLDIAGTARDNLTGDGFVAVLEQNPINNQSNIVRLAVPSEPASREYIASLLRALGKTFGEESWRDTVLNTNIAVLQNAVHSDISYVSDRLASILRMDPNRRPTVTVVGAELTEHAILGSAIQFENEQHWYQLFPVGLISKIIEIVSANASNVKYIA